MWRAGLLSAIVVACSQGPLGPAGPQGPQGTQGPQGPAGRDGAFADGGTVPVVPMSDDPAHLFSLSYYANCSAIDLCSITSCVSGQDCVSVYGQDCSGGSCPGGVATDGSNLAATLGTGPLVITSMTYSANPYVVRGSSTCKSGPGRPIGLSGTQSVIGTRILVAAGETLCVEWAPPSVSSAIISGYK